MKFVEDDSSPLQQSWRERETGAVEKQMGHSSVQTMMVYADMMAENMQD